MLISPGAAATSRDFTLAFIVLFAVWAGTSYGVLRGTVSTSKVWARGALIGAAEWMVAGIVPLIFSSRMLAKEAVRPGVTGAEQAGATIGTGLVGMMGIGMGVFMAIVCLIIYAIANRSPVEFARDAERRPCPQCGESIPASAKVCRFCRAAV